MQSRRTFAYLGAACFTVGIGLCADVARAQDVYPSRAARVLVGAPPGGSSDIGARLLTAKLAERLGQPFVVENKPGATGAVAAAEVSRAKPDGYTLLFTASWHSTAAAIKKELPYDPLKDFTFISTLTTYGMMIAVRPDSPFQKLEDVIAAAKANPGKLTFYSVGVGSGHHLIGESLNHSAGTEILHVPYKGSGQALTDFYGGRIDIMVDTMTVALTQVKTGKARALAITSFEPMPELPGVPLAWKIVPGLEYDSWLGLLGPPGMPPDLLAKLNKEMREIVQLPDIAARIKDLGAVPRAMSPEEFRARSEREIAGFKKIVEVRNIPKE